MSGTGGDATVDEAALRAAEAAFDRVMAGAASRLESTPADLEPADALRWAGDRVTEALAGFAELPLDRLLGLDLGSVDEHEPQDASGDGPRGEPVSISAAPGALAEVRIWIHQLGQIAAVELRFTLTDLLPAVGSPLPSAGASFHPPVLVLPAPVGASTVLRFRAPADTRPGRYHGLVVARGVADAVLPIIVVIS